MAIQSCIATIFKIHLMRYRISITSHKPFDYNFKINVRTLPINSDCLSENVERCLTKLQPRIIIITCQNTVTEIQRRLFNQIIPKQFENQNTLKFHKHPPHFCFVASIPQLGLLNAPTKNGIKQTNTGR